MFQFVPLMEGAVLFHENDFDRELGNSLYFLYKGRVKVINSEKSKGGAAASAAAAEGGAVEEKVLNTLEPGCFFGEGNVAHSSHAHEKSRSTAGASVLMLSCNDPLTHLLCCLLSLSLPGRQSA